MLDNYSVGDNMTGQTNLDKFNEFYKETYSNILRYIIIKCHNINDVNDIIQDVYLELWKIMNKKNIDDTNINSYLIGIAINKIKKYYSLVMRIRDISLFDKLVVLYNSNALSCQLVGFAVVIHTPPFYSSFRILHIPHRFPFYSHCEDNDLCKSPPTGLRFSVRTRT